MSGPEDACQVIDAPAKLTLSLRITGRRSDGYHLIDAEMVTLDLKDRLEIDPSGSEVVVCKDDFERRPAPADDLVRLALQLVGRSAGVVLHKRIPAGAGLGGGSADAAAVLRWAGWSDEAAAVALGADVPFCLVGGRARVRGVGEVIAPLPHRPMTVTLLTPPVFCSTPAVYRRWDDMGAPVGDHGNDLEPAALDLVPELGRYRDELAELAGVRPRLAGSGSTWFVEGAFPGPSTVVTRTLPG
jgi:4-diphosphocytidyl-2-C-methyl-D-erythritol kinase